MPIYEFDCAECGHGFERLQKVSDPDPSECPSCGRPGVKRRVSAPSFRLAGSGWYETDFKSDKDRRRNLASKDDGGGSSGPKVGGKSDPAGSGSGSASTSTSASP